MFFLDKKSNNYMYVLEPDVTPVRKFLVNNVSLNPLHYIPHPHIFYFCKTPRTEDLAKPAIRQSSLCSHSNK